MLIIGHRGARGHEPENTLRSIRRAFELGADGVEVDVYAVQGELVVIHDPTLDRTTNGRGYLMRKTFAHLRSLDAGLGEQIPTLAEVLDVVEGRGFINIELKGRHTAEPVAALIEHYRKHRGWRREDFLVSSFRRRRLAALAERGIRLGALFHRPPRGFVKIAQILGAEAIHPGLRHTTRALVEQAHAAGLKVFVYTVNEPADIERMRGYGVDGVFSDFPERVGVVESR